MKSFAKDILKRLTKTSTSAGSSKATDCEDISVSGASSSLGDRSGSLEAQLRGEGSVCLSPCSTTMPSSPVAGSAPTASQPASPSAGRQQQQQQQGQGQVPAGSAPSGEEDQRPQQRPQAAQAQSASDDYVSKLLAVSHTCPQAMRRSEWHLEDFELRALMYNGSISMVYHAVDKRSGITVALKLYRRSKLTEIERVQVAREIKLHVGLAHESIIAMYSAWKDKAHVYMALEWAPGGDVYSFLRNNGGRMSENNAVDLILEPFMSGLSVIHRMGVIHRDIKPENILMTRSLQVKIADFGLSIDSRAEIANTRLGTIDYLAPEILHCPVKHRPMDNKQNPDIGYDNKVDCWSVGILTYELLVGSPPFAAPTPKETLQMIASKEVEYPAFLSVEAVNFMRSVLIRDPAKRLTIAELLNHPWIRKYSRAHRDLPMADYRRNSTPGSYGLPPPPQQQQQGVRAPQPLVSQQPYVNAQPSPVLAQIMQHTQGMGLSAPTSPAAAAGAQPGPFAVGSLPTDLTVRTGMPQPGGPGSPAPPGGVIGGSPRAPQQQQVPLPGMPTDPAAPAAAATGGASAASPAGFRRGAKFLSVQTQPSQMRKVMSVPGMSVLASGVNGLGALSAGMASTPGGATSPTAADAAAKQQGWLPAIDAHRPVSPVAASGPGMAGAGRKAGAVVN